MMQTLIGHKGIGVLETVVVGSAGHSSRIRQEVSAIHEAAKLIVWLESKMDSLIKENRLDNRFIPPHSSIHIGQFSGGVAANIIAPHAKFLWDLRCIPQDSGADILQSFRDHCNEKMEQLKPILRKLQS